MRTGLGVPFRASGRPNSFPLQDRREARRFYQYAELERHPCFESLHGEERFQRMMAGVKARVEEMRREVDAIEAEGS